MSTNPPPLDAEAMRARTKARYEEIGERNRALEVEARRDRRRTLVIGALLAWFWCLVGLAGVGAAVNTTNVDAGWAWFWGGLVVGNGGMLATLVWTYSRLRDRGDL